MKMMIGALALAALATPALADMNTAAEQACMRSGPMSNECQYYRQAQQQENRLRQLEQEERNQQQYQRGY